MVIPKRATTAVAILFFGFFFFALQLRSEMSSIRAELISELKDLNQQVQIGPPQVSSPLSEMSSIRNELKSELKDLKAVAARIELKVENLKPLLTAASPSVSVSAPTIATVAPAIKSTPIVQTTPGVLECGSTGRVAIARCPGTGHSGSMCVHSQHDLVSESLSQSGAWEGSVVEIMQGFLKSGPQTQFWFVDAGSNLAYFSFCAFGVGARVLSIEASPWNEALARATSEHAVAASSDAGAQWIVKHNAIDDTGGGTLMMHGNTGNFGGSTAVKAENHPLHKPNDPNSWGNDSMNAEVSTATLDSIIKASIPAGDCISVMKVDVEGFEHKLLLGSDAFLTQRPPCYIMMEYLPTLLKAANSANPHDDTPTKIEPLMRKYGYEPNKKPNPAGPTQDLLWRLANPPDSVKHCNCR